LVLDPFSGTATTGVACKSLGRRYVGIETKKDYLEISKKRFKAIKGENK
jgi:DNA modification methylase